MTIEKLLELSKGREDLSEGAAERFYAFGFAQYEAGKWKEAASVFSVLCARRPFEARFWFGLGATLQESKEYERAMKAWAMTALLDPKDPYPHFHAAECALSMKNVQEAQLALKEAENKIDSIPHPLKDRISLLRGAHER